jgi:hypothetical protein
MEEFFKIMAGGFLGALLVAVINWKRVDKTEKEKRHSEYILEQLKNLYGPLCFLSSQNEKLLLLSNEIVTAYGNEFEGKKWGKDPDSQKILSKQIDSTINLANEYAHSIKANNAQIVDILKNKYAFIDDDDIGIMMEFVVDSIRMNKEFEENVWKDIPIEIYFQLGEVSYSRPEFISTIKKKFLMKQEMVKNYH